MYKSRETLFERFLEIKRTNGLSFYDSHTHPIDIMGVVGSTEGNSGKRHASRPSLLETLKYNGLALAVLRQLFFLVPKYIRGEIEKNYRELDEDVMLEEMEGSGIDTAITLPIYPHVSPEVLHSKFSSNKFIRLGSVDFSLDPSDIKKSLQEQLYKYSIVGIKLHPNVQEFYPNPAANRPDLRNKLEVVYEFAKENKLYLLFHGGVSFVFQPHTSRFEYRNYSTIKHFSDDSNFLRSLGVPVVIAHLGIYNVINPNLNSLQSLIEIPNVYFDTAAVNPKYIKKFLIKYGSKKIIFGSDMPYFHLRHSIKLTLEAIYKFDRKHFDELVLTIFNKNYEKVIYSSKT